MLLSKEVEVNINHTNVQKYLDEGYKFDTFINSKGHISVRHGIKIIVKVEDLDFKCTAKIKYECDYCHKIKEVSFCDYMRHKQHIGEKDACKECGHIKLGDINFEKYGSRSPFGRKEVKDKANKTVKERYGVNNVFQLDNVKDKIKNTNLKKYGVEYYTRTDKYKEKAKKTCLEKYGYDNVSKSPEIINKIKEVQFEKYGTYYNATEEGRERYKQFCLKNYGVENLFQNEEIKEKIKQTNLKKYGVEYYTQIPEVAKQICLKSLQTKYKNGTIPSSKQQDYLHKIYGGIKNYVVGNCALDVALIDDKIDIEGDFSGHWLSVSFGDITQEEFDKKEYRRKYYLKSKGWKELRIISKNDYLPNDEILLNMLDMGKEWFNKNHSWIKFNIDDSTYETSKGIYDFDFGDLRKIK